MFNNFDWALFLTGAKLSLQLTCVALCLGFLLSLSMVYLLQVKNLFFTSVIRTGITLTRGVPLLIQIFLLYYGAAQFEIVAKSPLWIYLQDPFFCICAVLTLNTAAYTTVLLESHINAIPKGEIESCLIFRMSLFMRMRDIILPRALASFWPAYSNEVIMVLKSTSLASTITLMDLLGAARHHVSQTYEIVPAFLAAGVFYLSLSFLLLSGMKFLKYILKISINKSLFSEPFIIKGNIQTNDGNH